MALLFSDNFQRANSNPINGSWAALTALNQFKIQGNVAIGAGTSGDHLGGNNSTGASWPNDQYATITIGVITGSDSVAPSVRMSSNGSGYIAVCNAGTGPIQIQRLTAGQGVAAPATSGNVTLKTGDKVRLEVQGTTLTCYLNGVPVCSGTDSNIASGSAGMMYFAASAAVNTITLWEGGNLVSVQTDDSSSADVFITSDTDKPTSVDTYIAGLQSKASSADVFITAQVHDDSHSADVDIKTDVSKSHSADVYISTNVLPGSTHKADAYIQPVAEGFVDISSQLIPPIVDPNAFVKLESNLAAPNLSSILLGTNLQAKTIDFVQLETTLALSTLNYVKLKTNLMLGGAPTHGADVVIVPIVLSYVQLGTNLIQTLAGTIECGAQFPDTSFINLSTWLVEAGKSQQAPGTYLTPTDDWASQIDALGVYQPVARFILNGVAMIVTGFTTGVISYQTRTRQWLRRVDANPGGLVVSTATSKRTLPNGQIVTTTTTTTQVQDITTVTTVITYSSSPRITKTITETNKLGATITRQMETDTVNGIVHTVEKKIVQSQPPTKENVQPITVTTLDGIKHYQFFGSINTEWAGGEAEGTTETDTATQIIPASLNGQTVDQFGNPILAKLTQQTAFTPDGKVINTTTEEVGTNAAGTTTTDTEQSWNGVQRTTKTTINNPDGSQTVKTLVEDLLTGNSQETTVENLTDETGLNTVTTTVVNTLVFTDPVSGAIRQQITTTRTVQGPTGTTTDTNVTTNNDFEDDIIAQKIKVYFIQEFTVNCIIDRFSMNALLEAQIRHQKNFAIVELLGQQLGNANLSWPLRQALINQFNQALECIDSLNFQALGKTYNVVFAPSAASFRAKYIPGTMPAVFELQIIVQERSDLITGVAGGN